MKELFKDYEGLVATLVRVTEQGKDIPVVAHDGRSDRQHIAGFALRDGYSEQDKISIKEFAEKLETEEHRWVAIYKATPGTKLINRGSKSVVHGFKPVKAADYIVVEWSEFILRLLSL